MALQLSNTTKNKGLNNVFRPSTLYAMIDPPHGLSPSEPYPNVEVSFNVANNGQISLAAAVQIVVLAGSTIEHVWLHTTPLNETNIANALVRINLTGDDVETYDNNGVYIINTINVAINT